MIADKTSSARNRPLVVMAAAGMIASAAYWQFGDQSTPEQAGPGFDADVTAVADIERQYAARSVHSGDRLDLLVGGSLYTPNDRLTPAGVARRVDYRKEIFSAFDDADPERRIQAIHRIYDLEPETATRQLQQVLISEKDGEVYELAEDTLTAIAGESAVRVVTGGLSDQDVAVRSEALEVFGEIGEAAVHLLAQVLHTEPEAALRLRALELLSDVDSPAAFSVLQAASRDRDPEVREAAAAIIRDSLYSTDAEIEEMDELAVYRHLDLRPFDESLLLDLSAQSPPETRIDAIQYLYGLDEQAGAEVLRAVLRHDADIRVREEALYTLVQIESDAARAAIIEALGDPAPDMRWRAIELIGIADHRPQRQALLAQVVYSDPDPALRVRALNFLGAEPGPVTRALLEGALSDADEEVSNLAQHYLKR